MSTDCDAQISEIDKSTPFPILSPHTIKNYAWRYFLNNTNYLWGWQGRSGYCKSADSRGIMNTLSYRVGKWRWVVVSGAGEIVRDILTYWEELDQLPGASILKANLARTVIALPPTSCRPALIIKQYNVRGVSERLKYLFFQSRAASEWAALHHLRKANVEVPKPLAFCEARKGRILFGAGLIMERVLNVQAISKWLHQRPVENPERIEILRQLGHQIAGLHDAGCRHRDLHGGNILVVEGSRDAQCRVVLIDHHACRIGAIPSESLRRKNLAKLFHSLLSKITDAEAIELLRAYEETSLMPKWSSGRPPILDELKCLARSLEEVRLRSRSKRCWKNSSEFVLTRSMGWRVYCRRFVPLESLRTFQEGRIDLEPIFNEGPRQLVGGATIELEKGFQPVVVEEQSSCEVWRRILYRVYPGPLCRAWGAARALDVRGIPNPQALALMVHYRYGLPAKAILITKRIVGARTLYANLLDHHLPTGLGARDDITRQIPILAKLIRRLHDANIYYRDLSSKNILMNQHCSGNDGFYLIHLESIMMGRHLTKRWRQKNLVQLGLLPEGRITVRECLKFLHAYDRGEGRYWSRNWVEALNRKLAAYGTKNVFRRSR